MTPELGLTQYRLGAVVLILKQTFRPEGFLRVITADTAAVKGPIKVSSCAGSIWRTCSSFDILPSPKWPQCLAKVLDPKMIQEEEEQPHSELVKATAYDFS